jgi:hypothetical protein
MKKTLLRWNESYFETFQQIRFPTQFFSFCVALTLILSVVGSGVDIFSYQNEISPRLWQDIVKELSVQIFVAALFAVRFFLLFFRDRKYFWLSQFVWFLTYLTLISQLSSSQSGCTKNAFPMFGENFSYLFVAYLFFSPLRQIVTLLVSFSRISIR